jgi:hypothetical protein
MQTERRRRRKNRKRMRCNGRKRVSYGGWLAANGRVSWNYGSTCQVLGVNLIPLVKAKVIICLLFAPQCLYIGYIQHNRDGPNTHIKAQFQFRGPIHNN